MKTRVFLKYSVHDCCSKNYIWLIHGTIIWTGKTCKKISSCMRDSPCRWHILKLLKYFEDMLQIFEFSHVKETVESCLVYVIYYSFMYGNIFWWCKYVFMNHSIMFLDRDNKTKKVSASFSYFFELLCEKN